jgi:hypothetical protein
MSSTCVSWRLFAFFGPGAVGDFDVFERIFFDKNVKHSGVAVLRIFTTLIGLVALPFIRFFGPDKTTLGARNALTAFAGAMPMIVS